MVMVPRSVVELAPRVDLPTLRRLAIDGASRVGWSLRVWQRRRSGRAGSGAWGSSDSWSMSSTPDQLRRDHARHNPLSATNWKVMRLSWNDVESGFPGVLAQLTALLRRRERP